MPTTLLETKKELVLNDIQKEALEALENYPGSKGVVVMPTGSGKTFLSVIWFQNILLNNPKARLLFICHTVDILEQANEKEFQIHLKEHDISYGYYTRTEKSENSKVTFATVQTLWKNLDKLDKDQFDYIIVDEAHHYQAKSFKKVVCHFRPKFLLGLTATPNRTDNKDIFEVCGDLIYSSTTKFAIEKGILCPFHYYCVDNDIDFSSLHFNGRNYKNSDLNRKLCVKEYDNAFLKEYKELAIKKFNRKKTVCFCATVEHAQRMAELFTSNGIRSTFLVGKRKEEDSHSKYYKNRRSKLKDFSEGKYDIIFVRDLFNEGVNVPDADCVILIRPTDSEIILTQQLGRELRISKGKDYL